MPIAPLPSADHPMLPTLVIRPAPPSVENWPSSALPSSVPPAPFSAPPPVRSSVLAASTPARFTVAPVSTLSTLETASVEATSSVTAALSTATEVTVNGTSTVAVYGPMPASTTSEELSGVARLNQLVLSDQLPLWLPVFQENVAISQLSRRSGAAHARRFTSSKPTLSCYSNEHSCRRMSLLRQCFHGATCSLADVDQAGVGASACTATSLPPG